VRDERRAADPPLPCFVRANGHNLGRGRVVGVYWSPGDGDVAPRMTRADVALDDPAGFVVERVEIEALFDPDNLAARMIGGPKRTPAPATAAAEVG
jgi:hypothetical protein